MLSGKRDFSSVSRWTSRLPFNSYECELWVMPWNLNGDHWNVCVLELRNSRMVVYESMRMGVSAGQALKEVLRQVVDGAVRHASTFSPLRGWDFKEPVNWEFLVVYGNPQPCGSDPALNNQCALYAVAHCREVVSSVRVAWDTFMPQSLPQAVAAASRMADLNRKLLDNRYQDKAGAVSITINAARWACDVAAREKAMREHRP